MISLEAHERIQPPSILGEDQACPACPQLVTNWGYDVACLSSLVATSVDRLSELAL